jgi:hypothetical protein
MHLQEAKKLITAGGKDCSSVLDFLRKKQKGKQAKVSTEILWFSSLITPSLRFSKKEPAKDIIIQTIKFTRCQKKKRFTSKQGIK